MASTQKQEREKALKELGEALDAIDRLQDNIADGVGLLEIPGLINQTKDAVREAKEALEAIRGFLEAG